MNYLFHIFVCLVLVVPTLQAADVAEAAQPAQETYVLKWPQIVYGCPHPSINIRFEEDKFRDMLAEAVAVTKEKADMQEWEENKRVLYDWIYALHESEKTLLSKPFETWSITEFQLLARYLTRVTQVNPGLYRSQSKTWLKLAKDADISERYKAIVSKPVMTDEDKAFMAKVALSCPTPEKVASDFTAALERIQDLMKQVKKQVFGEKKKNALIDLSAQLHFEIARISLFEDANLRLARLVTALVHLQNTLPIVIFSDAESYYGIIARCMEIGNAAPLAEYIMNLIQSTSLKTQEDESLLPRTRAAQGRGNLLAGLTLAQVKKLRKGHI